MPNSSVEHSASTQSNQMLYLKGSLDKIESLIVAEHAERDRRLLLSQLRNGDTQTVLRLLNRSDYLGVKGSLDLPGENDTISAEDLDTLLSFRVENAKDSFIAAIETIREILKPLLFQLSDYTSWAKTVLSSPIESLSEERLGADIVYLPHGIALRELNALETLWANHQVFPYSVMVASSEERQTGREAVESFYMSSAECFGVMFEGNVLKTTALPGMESVHHQPKAMTLKSEGYSLEGFETLRGAAIGLLLGQEAFLDDSTNVLSNIGSAEALISELTDEYSFEHYQLDVLNQLTRTITLLDKTLLTVHPLIGVIEYCRGS